MRFALPLFATFLCSLPWNTAFADRQWHVAVHGDDRSEGTVESPLRSLREARDRVRLFLLESQQSEVAEVVVHEGYYQLDETLEFTSADSGSEKFPVVYRAEGNVVLSGGIRLLPQDAESNKANLPEFSAAARPNILRWNLKAMGLAEAIALQPRSHRTAMQPASVQLFSGDAPLQQATWPEQGWANPQHWNDGNRSWTLPSDGPLLQGSSAWVHGFWNSDASDALVSALRGNEQGTTSLRLNSDMGDIQPNFRYRLINVASQLDREGEWYLDEQSGYVYVWPVAHSQEFIVATRLETIVSLYDVQNLEFRGFAVEGGRVMGVEIAGGKNVVLENCKIRHHGNVGVHVYHGAQHAIRECQVHHSGSSAIRIEGGDRNTLESCEHLVAHNTLHDFCTLYLGRRAAVDVHGVGISVRNNVIYKGPDMAIHLHGNDHLVERNEIHDVCLETDDSGAIYLGQDPTYRGNRVRHNFIHDIGNYAEVAGNRRSGIMAVYLDDFASGTTVTGNVFRNTVRGIAIGGGRDNVIECNVALNVLAGIQIDCRGNTWAHDQITSEQGRVRQLVNNTLVQNPILAERYPSLGDWGSDQPQLAKGNIIRFNTVESVAPVDLFDGLTDEVVKLDHNVGDVDSVFVDVKQNNFTLRHPSQAEGFQAIPFASIGLQNPSEERYVARTQSTK